MTIDYRIGDVRDVMASIPDGSIHLIATSPPFLALRSYLAADHEHKGAEIGSEANPAAFLDTLLALTAEWGRVLAPWGSLAIELGDTYSGSGGAGGDYNEGGRRDGQERFNGSARMASGAIDAPQDEVAAGNHRILGEGHRASIRNMNNKVQGAGPGWPLPKSLALVPQLYAIALAYGINPLTGQPSPAGRWRVRNVIVWHRPNPAVGALGDKFRPSTSYIVVATRSAKRWFDLTAVRREPSAPSVQAPSPKALIMEQLGEHGKGMPATGIYHANGGAPPLDTWLDEYDASHDTWTLTTQPSKLAHYAMWPAKLAERLILSMCPLEVCSVCGEPRRRVERSDYVSHGNNIEGEHQMPRGLAANGSTILGVDASFKFGRATKMPHTLGWTDCGHNAYAPGVVLDPFAGTFTTGLTAEYHGCDAIGIDLNPANTLLVDARREEVRRALNPTHVRTIAGQGDLFAEVAL